MKRIVVCADGTWDSPEDDTPTHVVRVARAIAPIDPAGTQQVVFYDWGVGADAKKWSGGITGAGIDKNILDCYRFIVHNYDPGDALFFFGFSRGAYTVRSLGGFIRNCGVLRREQAARIPEAYALYRKRTKSSHPDADASKQFRAAYAVADRTPIAFIGAWDTVGALGVPVPFWGTLGAQEFLFHDTSPSSIIQHARHAVAIDERRVDYAPTLWDRKPGVDLVQVWFSGVHADVGGGYKEHALGDCAAQWMLAEAASFGLAVEPHLAAGITPDPRAKLNNSYKHIFKLRGKALRKVAPMVHASVKTRWDDPAVTYKSPALEQLLTSVNYDWSRITVVN